MSQIAITMEKVLRVLGVTAPGAISQKPYRRFGKQVLFHDKDFAQACDEDAAQVIVEALNFSHLVTNHHG